MRSRGLTFLLLLLMGALGAASAFAQAGTASIRGKVTDESSAALGTAQITAVGKASGFVKTINVEKDGDSEVLELSVALPDRNGNGSAADADTTAAAGEA